MVKFFRAVLLHLFAIVVAVGLFVVGGFFVAGVFVAAFAEEPIKQPERAILVFPLNVELYDSPSNIDPVQEAIAEIQGDETVRLPLRQVLQSLEEVKTDDKIEGLLLIGNLTAGGGLSNSIATLTELRQKLIEVKNAGKKIYAYSHSEGIAELYVKSVADEHLMDPFGMFDYRGLASQVAYLGGTFDRFGVEYQVIRAGAYKSAGESYVASEMSAEAREELAELLKDLWLDLRSGTAEGTGLAIESLDTLADSTPIIPAEDAVQLGLVDGLIRYDELLEKMIEVGGYAAVGKTFNQISLEDYVAVKVSNPISMLPVFGSHQVAVVYAEGVIVDGQGDASVVGGDRFSRLMRQLRKDDDVKAVVLRVNSPGGSATASEAIAREVELTNAKKPVVVSMGGYAASGGYYISAPAEAIFAQPTTVTGSIGVVAMIPNVEELAGNYEVNFETVQTNEHGTLWSLFESRSGDQIGMLQDMIDHTYENFLRRVSEGREMPMEAVRAVSEGRAWSGTDALSNGLVDRLGGLEDAITHAADLAGLGSDYEIRDLPRPETLEEVIASALSGDSPLSSRLSWLLPKVDEHLGPLAEDFHFLRHMNDRYHVYTYSSPRVDW